MQRRALQALSYWKRLWKRRFHLKKDPQEVTAEVESNKGNPSLPPAPRDLLAGRVVYEVPLLNRGQNSGIQPDEDTPLAALYRIYEHLVLDQHIEIRNEIEAFWYHADWAVREIPDPSDPHPERYACLACIPALLCLAFNKRIGLGLPRDAPAIFTRDMLDSWRTQEQQLEEEPPWTDEVPCLSETLAIPHWDNDQRDFVIPDSSQSVSQEFSRKNILLLQPHIHFA